MEKGKTPLKRSGEKTCNWFEFIDRKRKAKRVATEAVTLRGVRIVAKKMRAVLFLSWGPSQRKRMRERGRDKRVQWRKNEEKEKAGDSDVP